MLISVNMYAGHSLTIPNKLGFKYLRRQYIKKKVSSWIDLLIIVGGVTINFVGSNPYH